MRTKDCGVWRVQWTGHSNEFRLVGARFKLVQVTLHILNQVAHTEVTHGGWITVNGLRRLTIDASVFIGNNYGGNIYRSAGG